MKKILIILLFPLGAGLIAIDGKKSDVIREYNNQSNQEWPDRSRSRSISYDTESSDLSGDDSSDDDSDSGESLNEDTSSNKLIKSLRHQGGHSEKMLLERLMPYGGHFFGGAMVLLIAYKFYRAGYL